MAIKALKEKQVRRIILTRPAVEAGENLGFLPGDMQAKINPYLRPLLDALREMREYHRFLRGMVAWTGYRTVVLPYAERERIGGRPSYSLRARARLAANATFSFSLVPLKLALVVGLGFLLLAAAEAVYVASFWITGRQHRLVPGWSSLMFMVLIVGAALMIAVGLVGIYVGYIFQEVKRRPVYLVRDAERDPDDRPRPPIP